jgi:hypothetical protein
MDNLKIIADVLALAEDETLFEETHMQARVEALDFLAFVGHYVQARRQPEPDADLVTLERAAQLLGERLEETNARLFVDTRRFIQTHRASPDRLRSFFDRYTNYARGSAGEAHIGYDGLDALFQGVLNFDAQPTIYQLPDQEMVHFEPTPVRAIFDLLDNADLKSGDVFYDLGSGLGNVAILVALFRPDVVVKGVEYEPVYCRFAARQAAELGLSQIEFIQADAREAVYTDGTVFFMFTPFKDGMLQTVLDRLRVEAQTRPIKICSYGSCTFHIAAQPWLTLTDPAANHAYKLAVFSSK